MKTLPLLLILAASVTAIADDITTITGQEYKDATISRIEPDGLILMTDSGIEKVSFKVLPKEIQDKYGYDPKKAEQFAAMQEKQKQATAATIRAQQVAAQQARVAGEPKQKPEADTTETDKPAEGPAKAPDRMATSTAIIVRGEVIQRTDRGLLISCDDDEGKIGNRAKGSIWLVGLDAPEDAHISGKGAPNGTYNYTTVRGAERIADCYKWAGGSVKK